MPSTHDLRTSLTARLAQLDQEATKLRAALEALDGKAPAPAKRAPRRQSAKKAAPAAPVQVAPAGKLRKVLADSNDGLSASALADEANAAVEQVNVLLREMEAEGQVERSGQRRGTRWHAIANAETPR
jgi:predicted Rossmann fold nucleotide-binding protein DprA/Smf involved in DNA uptake